MTNIRPADSVIDLTLEDLSERPFLIWGGFMRLEEYERNRSITLSERLQTYKNGAERLLGWIPLNPSKKPCVDAINATYVTNDVGNAFPSNLAFQRLYDLAVTPNPSVVFLKGRRGVGKTAALNSFFNKNAQLFKSKGITFFRCDARKIEAVDKAIWTKKNAVASDSRFEEFKEGISLVEYIDAHNFYVALMYARQDPMLQGFAVRMEDEQTQQYPEFGEFGEFLDLHATKDEYDLWKEIVRDFKAAAKLEEDHSIQLNDMVSFIAQVIDRRIRPNECQDRLINHFHKHLSLMPGFLSVILTIDGVDNFSRVVPAGRSYYDNLLKQLQNYLPSDKTHRRYNTVLISLRPESYHELRHEVVAGYSFADTLTLDVIAPNVRQVVSRRVATVLHRDENTVSFFEFANALRNSNDLFAIFLVEVEKFIEKYVDAFLERLKLGVAMSSGHDRGATDGKAAQVLEILFASNMRSMLRNIIGSYAHCREYFDKYIRLHASVQFFQWLHDHPEFIFEGSLLLGERVVWDDEGDISPARRGRWCPPIFSYPIDLGREDAWHGLGLIRILQHIAHNRASTERDCVKTLESLGYPKELARWFFSRALMYGLIEVNEARVRKNYVPFSICRKGDFVLRSSGDSLLNSVALAS